MGAYVAIPFSIDGAFPDDLTQHANFLWIWGYNASQERHVRSRFVSASPALNSPFVCHVLDMMVLLFLIHHEVSLHKH